MLRGTTILLGCVLLVFVAEASSQRIANTVYRIPLARPSPPKIHRARRDVNDEPLWLYKGDDVNRAPSTADHPYLPTYIDDVKLDPNRRYARSVDSPSARRGGSHSTSSGSRGTGPTHPGYNRRNARSIRMPTLFDPQPSPTFPKPINPFFPGTRGPGPKPIYPIYARHTRDVLPLKKPTHYDISLPGWNPHARVQPWQKIRVRTGRDIHDLVDVENEDFENEDEIVDLD